MHVTFYLVKLPPNQGQRSVTRLEGETDREQGGRQCELRGDGGWRSGERKGDVLIVDGSSADSCNDLICLCVWRWKDRTPPERIAPSFSVNRVNYLYNEICKVVNFSSSLFLPSQLFTLPHTFWVLSSFPSVVLPVSSPLVTSVNIISSRFAFSSTIPFFHISTSLSTSLLSSLIYWSLFLSSLFWPYLPLSRSLLIYTHPTASPSSPHRGLGI